MHELSIMNALFEQVEAIALQHRAHKILQVEIEMGELSNVVPGLLQQAFRAFAEMEPLLQDARLKIRELPLKLRCRDCGAEFHPQGYRFLCSNCLSPHVLALQGEELLLRDVELEIEGDDHG